MRTKYRYGYLIILSGYINGRRIAGYYRLYLVCDFGQSLRW